jgi:hypothetical protein
MTTIKRVIISSVAGGVGFAVALAIIFGTMHWYQCKPKPWNKNAITASYDSADVEGEKNHVVFYYTLQNNTAFDYGFSDLKSIMTMFRLEKQKSLSFEKNDELFRPDCPIWIPAKQRMRFALHLALPYDKSLKKDATKDEKNEYRKNLEIYLNKEFTNLDGFTLFDEVNRYQIELPKGW